MNTDDMNHYSRIITKAGLSQLEFPLLKQILGGELRQIIDSVKGRGGGGSVTKSIPEGGGGNGVEFHGIHHRG